MLSSITAQESNTALLMNSFYEPHQPAHERAWKRYETRVKIWKFRDNPFRFYLWLAWLILHPIFWVANCVHAWVYRRTRKKIKVGDFTEYMFPAIHKPINYMEVAHTLLSVQPMTGPVSQMFYMNYNDIRCQGDPIGRYKKTWVDIWGWGWAR